ncbi:hypothetical protein C8R44DRAFT_895571 [Mycena epipterygia]|nr:hypothetical protein C8R44DRAFT_895571 [Mycena epipterygia]
MSCDPNFAFTIDGHNMTIIEASAESLTVDSIQICVYIHPCCKSMFSAAGQRYSLILTADQTVEDYWIRTAANGATLEFDNEILRYVGADDIDPSTNATTATAALVETDLHPLGATAVPGTAVAGARKQEDSDPKPQAFSLALRRLAPFA